jgi:peroxiredoxin
MSACGDRARTILARHHLDDERIDAAVAGSICYDSGSQAAEALLREALTRSPHREVRGRACFALARFLKEQADCIPQLRMPVEGPNLCEKYAKRWGEASVNVLKGLDPDRLREGAASLFTRALEEYGDISTYGLKNDDTPIGVEAEKELHELCDLAVGQVAPDIVGEDVDGNPFRLSEFHGNVILLTFSANWCGWCCKMYPQMRELSERLKGKPFVILSVNVDEERDVLRKSIVEGEITWRCWWDGPGRPICREWIVSGFPTIYVLDAAGVIRYKNVRGSELDEAIASLVGAP